ncbi:MAG: transposase [Chloroflexi bacterium]|nr:transposase [Chloroflexota bacterium]
MAYSNGRVSTKNPQLPPIVAELQAVFEALPDEELLTKLQGPRRRGRPGYSSKVLWRCFVAHYYLGLPSVSDLIRTLYDNPYVAKDGGIESPWQIPSQPTFSRFFAKLSNPLFIYAVRDVMRELTRRMFATLPGFGKSVAIDSTDIKAWSNGGKRGRNPKKHGGKVRQQAKVGEVSDSDAGWIVKKNTHGKNKYVWGYKVHILADTTYELPLVADVSKGNLHDVNKATPLLRQARLICSKFHPDYVIADKGYSSDHLRHIIRRQYRAQPIIDPNPANKRAFAREPKTAEWKVLYNRRTAIERLNGRLKDFRRLDSVRVRGAFKVRVHVMLSVVVLQAQALATGSLALVRKVA